MPTDIAVELKGLAKEFDLPDKTKTIAVAGLDLRIRRGEIFSLVGPDGAGKTTTIKMMCGVLPPTRGSVEVFGLNIRAHREQVKRSIGYLSQRFSLYHDLTVDENIEFFAEIHKVKNFKLRREELLQFTRLTPFRERLAGKLSGGMKQKLALACTLIHTPEVIFLDEPTTGVDPVSRRDFWKILSTLLKQGITIVVSTPYLDEAERSSRVALMNEGTILQCDVPDAIKAKFPYEVTELVCSEVRRAAELAEAELGAGHTQMFGDRLHLLTKKGTILQQALVKKIERAKISVSSVRTVSPSLEDVFIEAVRR